MIKKYPPQVEAQMQGFYSRLKEREQRLYAAIESQKFGYGGKAYIMRLLDIHHMTLNKGIKELGLTEPYASLPVGKQRRVGGGRKKKFPSIPTALGNCAP